MGAEGATCAQAILCRLADIADPGARGFEVETSRGLIDVIAVRIGNAVHGFHNACPHQGTPLETFPDRFMSRDGSALICSTHGAMFRPGDGLCFRGPCRGKRLRPAPVEQMDGNVVLNVFPAPGDP